MKFSLTICLIFLIFIVVGCGKKDSFTYTESYVVDTVDLKDVVIQNGEVQPVVKVGIKSEASGKIDSIRVREGQKIKKGELILSIDPGRLIYRKNALNLEVKRVRLDLSTAQRNFDDATKLAGTGTVSEKQLFDLNVELEKIKINLQQQLLELNDINDQLQKTRVTSPMDGVVISLDVEEGEIAVSATAGFQGGTPLATIADVNKLEVVSRIGEADYAQLRTGQKATLRLEALEGSYTTGTINFIAMNAKKEKIDDLGTFEVRITIDSLVPGIVPGVNITAEFTIMEKKCVLGIPNHFVMQSDSGYSVIKVNSGTTGSRSTEVIPIRVGKTDYSYYEILSGLKKGEIVVYRDSLLTVNTANRKKGNKI